MAFDPLTGGQHGEPPVASGDWRADHRARIAHAERERLERKQQELLEQVSKRNTPAERIRIWERRHGLTLPRDSNHRLLSIVAAATDLALDQVSEEQRRRLAGVKTEEAVVPTVV
jgi:acetyl esterase/lipase